MLFPPLSLLTAAGTVALGLLLFSRRRASEGDHQYVHTFRADRYGALNKLLSSDDLVFVSEQGLPFHRALLYRFRRFRVTLAYLRALSDDFGRVHRSARHLIVCSDVDLPELSSALMRAQLVFWGASALAHAEAVVMLLGFSLGIRNAQVALGSLLKLSRTLAAAQHQSSAAFSRA